jgi:hypothetical protein
LVTLCNFITYCYTEYHRESTEFHREKAKKIICFDTTPIKYIENL